MVLNHVEDGDLDGALAAAIEGTERFPGFTDLWFLRFDLLLYAEDLDEARSALRAVVASDPLNAPGAVVCLDVLEAEVARRAVLAGRAEPETLGPFSAAARAGFEALVALAAGDWAGAEAAVQAARQAAPRLQGSADDLPFQELRDVDDPVAHVLELLLPGRYLWLPLESLRWVEVLPLRTFLDFAWVPVHIELRDGAELRGHVPGLYAGTGARADGRLRLGYDTDWEAVTPGLSRARGQRCWQTEGRLVGIRQVRVLSFT